MACIQTRLSQCRWHLDTRHLYITHSDRYHCILKNLRRQSLYSLKIQESSPATPGVRSLQPLPVLSEQLLQSLQTTPLCCRCNLKNLCQKSRIAEGWTIITRGDPKQFLGAIFRQTVMDNQMILGPWISMIMFLVSVRNLWLPKIHVKWWRNSRSSSSYVIMVRSDSRLLSSYMTMIPCFWKIL